MNSIQSYTRMMKSADNDVFNYQFCYVQSLITTDRALAGGLLLPGNHMSC